MPPRCLPNPCASRLIFFEVSWRNGTSSSMISCSPMSAMAAKNGAIECSPSRCARAPPPMPLRSAQALPERRVEAGVDAATLVGQHLDRVHHADAARQVRPEESEKCLVHPAFGRAEGGVEGAVHELWCRAAPVDGQFVALDGDRTRVLDEDVLPQRRVGEQV